MLPSGCCIYGGLQCRLVSCQSDKDRRKTLVFNDKYCFCLAGDDNRIWRKNPLFHVHSHTYRKSGVMVWDGMAYVAQKPNDNSPRLQNDNGLLGECTNGKQGSATVSEAIKEIKQAIQMSKNVQLKSTHSGNNCEGPNQPVWVPR
ncbi:uncharacterized protein TNCV_492751 [Trichonephila clavipes]|nr:uncharacterized protein TNCV_492751 [Trichonephila clavipes]